MRAWEFCLHGNQPILLLVTAMGGYVQQQRGQIYWASLTDTHRNLNHTPRYLMEVPSCISFQQTRHPHLTAGLEETAKNKKRQKWKNWSLRICTDSFQVIEFLFDSTNEGQPFLITVSIHRLVPGKEVYITSVKSGISKDWVVNLHHIKDGKNGGNVFGVRTH